MTIHTMKAMAGQPVIAVDTAEEVGKVKHFVVAPDVSRIERLHIDGRRKNASFANWDDLESFGLDRVMIVSAQSVTDADDERDMATAKGDLDVVGARLLDTAGFEHGTVEDASFEAESGAILSVRTSEGVEIPAGALRGLGSYALVFDA